MNATEASRRYGIRALRRVQGCYRLRRTISSPHAAGIFMDVGDSWSDIAGRLRLWPVAILVGFPIGGLLADVVVDGVDSVGAALGGGLIAGALTGAAEWFALKALVFGLLTWLVLGFLHRLTKREAPVACALIGCRWAHRCGEGCDRASRPGVQRQPLADNRSLAFSGRCGRRRSCAATG